MLVTFRTKAHANITMFGDVAVELLKLAGLSGNLPTALAAADVPVALSRLEAALAKSSAEPPPGPRRTDEDDEPTVPIGRRAFPLIELLRDAAAARTEVLITQGGSPP